MASAAQADVGFLLPNTFHTDETGRVTVIASFSDQFPSVEHPLRSNNFHVVKPDGEKEPFESVQNLEQMTALFTVLETPGVYRLSSGERLGRKGEVSRQGGAYVRLGQDGIDVAALPDGAPIFTSQTATVSEVYVRRGDVALPETLTTSGRLSVRLSAGAEGFRAAAPMRVSVTFDGSPLTGADVTLIAPFGAYTDHSDGVASVLDRNGEAELSSQHTGPHSVLVRHIAEAPAGAETDVRSYSTALVFEVLQKSD
jgi:hypothetical protein